MVWNQVIGCVVIATVMYGFAWLVPWVYRRYGAHSASPPAARLISVLMALLFGLVGTNYLVGAIAFLYPLWRLVTLLVDLTAVSGVAVVFLIPRFAREYGHALEEK